MTKARLDGLTLLVLGGVFFVAIGVMMEVTNPLGMTDFEEIYYAARSAAHHADPYVPAQVAAVYQADNGSLPADAGVSHTKRLIIFICSNLPTTLFLVAPLAALPWKLAAAIWMALIAAAFIVACFLVWQFGADEAPRIYGGLICLLLVNSGLFLCAGNTAGLAVSLSVIAVCCFLRDRFVSIGVVCLAIALAMKPHDAGAVWLYFLLAGGEHRRRAVQTLVLTAVIAGAAILWVSHAAPHWYQHLHANLQAAMLPGGRDNPGPTTQGGRGIGMIISLQAILSLIRDNAAFYNPIAYLLCAPLAVLWCVKALRSGFSMRLAWLGLAAISAIAMLPVYHRTYDARLLLLAVPACAILWCEQRAPGRWALPVTLAAMVLTGDIFWIVFFQITHYSGAAVVFGMFPGPIALLAAAIFYLWMYLRPAPAGAPSAQSSSQSRC
jgi:Glycosyltransferase family 87